MAQSGSDDNEGEDDTYGNGSDPSGSLKDVTASLVLSRRGSVDMHSTIKSR
jgi:hypothetical protein